jgi:hypothetical protein
MKPAAKIRTIYNSTKKHKKVSAKNKHHMERLKSRKWLLSMFEGEVRILPASVVKYKNIKTTAHQMKQMGLGVWSCSKRKLGDYTIVTRIQ